jgi:hypothetical protein
MIMCLLFPMLLGYNLQSMSFCYFEFKDNTTMIPTLIYLRYNLCGIYIWNLRRTNSSINEIDVYGLREIMYLQKH